MARWTVELTAPTKDLGKLKMGELSTVGPQFDSREKAIEFIHSNAQSLGLFHFDIVDDGAEITYTYTGHGSGVHYRAFSFDIPSFLSGD